MAKTLFVVNANAGGVRKHWQNLEPKLIQWVKDYNVVMTHFPEDVTECLNQSVFDGVERLIAVGGDGTNKVMVNAIMQHKEKHPDHDFIFGTIPAGTGSDFARGIDIPITPEQATKYILTEATPHLIDLGLATFADQKHYFLNIANAGIANDVVQRVERSSKRPWTFFTSILQSLLRYQPEPVIIELDGEHYFEGKIIVMGVANGKSTGQGLLIAPHAIINDGWFDVVIGEEMSLFKLVNIFAKAYSGDHIGQDHVFNKRAKHVRIIAQHGKPIGMDLDGEASDGALEITYQIVPSAITLLM